MLDMVLIIAATAGIVLVMLTHMARSKARSSRLGCTNNLKQVGLAFRQWALDNDDKFPMQVSATNGGAIEQAGLGSAYAAFLVMSNELSTPKILVCPNESKPKRVAANSFSPTILPGSPFYQAVRQGAFPLHPPTTSAIS